MIAKQSLDTEMAMGCMHLIQPPFAIIIVNTSSILFVHTYFSNTEDLLYLLKINVHLFSILGTDSFYGGRQGNGC